MPDDKEKHCLSSVEADLGEASDALAKANELLYGPPQDRPGTAEVSFDELEHDFKQTRPERRAFYRRFRKKRRSR